MRADDEIRIIHMIEASEKISRYTSGRERDALDDDEMLLLALVKLIEILGEAASNVSDETRTAATHIPWRVIKDMRNRLSHAYFDIDLDIVWETVSARVPALIPSLRALIDPPTPKES